MNIAHCTERDFDRISWHDCHIWGVAFCPGNPKENDWTSDLVLDIDFIVEWVCAVDGRGGEFRVAPAAMVFHGVTDPRIAIDWDSGGAQVALHPVSIDRIDREPVREQKVFLDRPYYRWRILMNWPKGGEIAFGAVGFTQRLLAKPVLTKTQHLSLAGRRRLVEAAATAPGPSAALDA